MVYYFSGFSNQVTVRKEDIQNLLRRLIDSQTILVGHSLDSDLKVPPHVFVCMYVQHSKFIYVGMYVCRYVCTTHKVYVCRYVGMYVCTTH